MAYSETPTMFNQDAVQSIMVKPKQQAQPQKQGPTGLKKLLIDALPTIGGTIGGIGGSFVAPVAGTAVGGATGAGLGEFLAEKLRGEDPDAGKIAENAAFGALPGAGKLLKSGVGLVKAAAAGKDLEGLVQGARTAAGVADAGVMKPSMLQRAGQRLTENGSGLKAEPTVGGMSKLDQQSQFMSKYTGTPRQQRIAMEKDMGNLSGQVDSILEKNPTPIKGTDVRAQVQQGIDNPLKYDDVDLSSPGVQKALESHLGKFENTTTAKDLNDYIKKLNPIAKRAQDKIARGVTPTDKEAAALTAKRAGDEVLSGIPEIKPLKQQMAQIFDVTPQVAKAGEQKIGLPMTAGISTKTPVQVTKGIQSKIGSLLQGGSKKVDQNALTTAFRPSNLVKPVIAQAGAQALGSALATPDQPTQDQSQLPDASSTGTGSLPAATQPADQQTTGSVWDNPDMVRQAYTKALKAGDIKAAQAIIDGYNAFSKPSSTSSSFTKPTAQQHGLAQSGLTSLQQLQDMIGQDPSLITREATPGQDLPIVGGLVSNAAGTGEYNATANNVLDSLARVRTGAAMTKQEETFYRNLLPKAGDNEQTVRSKISALAQAFTPFMNNDQ
jgi:hypothetical protein